MGPNFEIYSRHQTTNLNIPKKTQDVLTQNEHYEPRFKEAYSKCNSDILKIKINGIDAFYHSIDFELSSESTSLTWRIL